MEGYYEKGKGIDMADEYIWERYELARNRILEIAGAESEAGRLGKAAEAYFKKTAFFLQKVTKAYAFIQKGGLKTASLEELEAWNQELYADILPENYEKSYANPKYAVTEFGEKYGQLLSFLYTELRSMIPYAFEQDREEMVIRMELFLEMYSAFAGEAEDGAGKEVLTGRKEGAAAETLPPYEQLQQIVYWFASDYSEPAAEKRLQEQLCPQKDFALRIIMESDLNDLRYLYSFGEYISENERKTAEYLNSLSEETIQLMADTYTEGYRIGFEVCNKDIKKKKVVNIRYRLGFERMIRAAVINFEKIGLKPTIYRTSISILQGKSIHKNGYFGKSANKQYEYDHKDDQALYLDKQYINRKLEVMKQAFEGLKQEASWFGGPAVVETFGETPFTPQTKPEALRLSDRQQELSVEYMSRFGAMQNEYIKGEERSFTIIAFPEPAIGERYEEIFNEIIKINTLDYNRYQRMQQSIIDVLDGADYVSIKGMNGNRTDMQVKLHELQNPAKETNFENCVADVNIPVGEVFTSPLLKGTNGVLHVSRVFLNELEYKDLEITFADGMIADYRCANFEKEEENRKYIRDNVLYHHETLPLGEFAVGTNTVAYVAAQKYGIEDKLPILIAEKMGPHFAVGDTCYSHEEDVMTYNPDGKAIIARENEVSARRKEDANAAYYNCHTDITIPYDELGELAAVMKSGEKKVIIEKGRFVLAGCEELNEPFES